MEDFTYHRPVLVTEAIELLSPHPGSLILDGTCGGGGHTEAILRTGADVLALDQDPDAIEFARLRLAEFGSRVTLRHANFRNAIDVLDELGIAQIGGALIDLGVSSRQLENADRGFSLMRNGPLDMRMDPRRELTADEVVNTYSEEELTRIFRELGEEPAARRIASQIVKMRKETSFRDTVTLAKTVEKIVARHGRRHPATQVFQALRMEVNDELGALQEGLIALTSRLEPGSRIAVITFHSLEDRIVKNFFRERSREWLDRPEWPEPRPNPQFELRLVNAKPIEPDAIEQRANPRSRSAKLRVAGKDLMKQRRRKNFNPIDAPSLARWIVLAAFLAVTGLSYVYLTVQLHHQGVQKKKLEQELVALRTQNEDAKVQIAALTSRTALQRRLQEGSLKMIPITEQSIVRLNSAVLTPGEDEVRPVVNTARRPMKWNSRTRCTIVCALFALLFSVFSYRLIYLQMVKHEYYSKIAAEKNVGRNVIRAERGAIYDTHDEVLAQNVPVATVVADGTLINRPDDLVPILAKALHLPEPEIAEKIRTPSSLHRVEKRVARSGSSRARAESGEGKTSRDSLRTRHGPRLSKRLDALPCGRFHRFQPARHSRASRPQWSNICAAKMVIATSSMTRRAARSCSTAAPNIRRATVARFT